MTNKSNYKNDLGGEKEVTKFLERFFYTRGDVKDFYRFESKDEQFRGMDVRFSFGELKDIIVDEKAQLYYVNEYLPTFAFEVEYMLMNQLKTGWLIDMNKDTEYYLLIWISADENKYEKSGKLRCEDITSLDCILIKRVALLNHLFSGELSVPDVPSKCDQIRAGGIFGRQNDLIYETFNFNWSGNLPESPINIVVYKSTLKGLADVHFTLGRNGDEAKLQIHISTSFQRFNEMVTSI